MKQPEVLLTFNPGDRIEVYNPGLNRWFQATVVGYQRMVDYRGCDMLPFLYVRADGEKYEQGHFPTTENFRPCAQQLALF